jgi:hypothetical protein
MEAFSILYSDHTIFLGGRMARRKSRNILHDLISAPASCSRRFTVPYYILQSWNKKDST